MKRKHLRKKNYSVSIGVAGVEHHVGTTHLAIMLANYLASKERCQVAVIDQSQTRSIGVLQGIYEGAVTDGECSAEQCFRVHQVDYYSHSTKKDIMDIFYLGYDYVIFDFGKIEYQNTEYEILRCNVRFLVGSCCEWQQASFHEAMCHKEFVEHKNQWQYASFLGSAEIRRNLAKKYRISIYEIPFEEDPFCLHRSHFDALKTMLQEAMECL